jgi:hypothetical protein
MGTKKPLVQPLVEYIRIKDQAQVCAEDTVASLSLLFQVVKQDCVGDEEIVTRGIALIDAADKAVTQGTLALGWDTLAAVNELRAFSDAIDKLASAGKEVIAFLTAAPKITLALPGASDVPTAAYRWTDGLFLDFAKDSKEGEPLGWRELVRAERNSTPTGQPYGFLAVRSKRQGRDSYLVYVRPGSSLSLKGLSSRMNLAEEQRNKEQRGSPGARQRPINASTQEPGLADAEALGGPQRSPAQCDRTAAPWYDGHAHAYTLVGTGGHGTALDPTEVLDVLLTSYSPLWRETVGNAEVRRLSSSGDAVNNWLHRYRPAWAMDGFHGSIHPCGDQEPYRLADAIASLQNACKQNGTLAAYLPVMQLAPQTLPAEDTAQHILLALYLITHQRPPLCSAPPHISAVRKWAQAHAATQSGLWWAVSESFGIVALDYAPSAGTIKRFRDELVAPYTALLKQMRWTDDLSPVIRQQKRAAAIADFVARNC